MYKYENYNKVKQIIDARRDSARAKAEECDERLRNMSGEISEIDEELRGTGLLIFRAACSGEDITPIRKRNSELLAMRKRIAVSLGFPEDYSEIKYTCEKCSDTGFVDSKMCSCFRELLLTENVKSSGMGRLIEKQSFENFDLSYLEDDKDNMKLMQANLKVAKDFAKGFGSKYKGKNLLLIGKTGTGKTHISTAIAKEVISNGYDVLYDSAQNIVSAFENDKFRSGYTQSQPTADKYLECELLILDDLGAEFVNQFTVSCLYNLFNTRNNRGLSTIISTNLSADELAEKYEDRIYSRIVGSDYTVLFFGGRDHRLFAK